jgi:hypothetical protein
VTKTKRYQGGDLGWAKVTGVELLPKTESGVQPIKLTLTVPALVGGEGFKTKFQIVVDALEIPFKLGQVVSLAGTVMQHELELETAAADV